MIRNHILCYLSFAHILTLVLAGCQSTEDSSSIDSNQYPTVNSTVSDINYDTQPNVKSDIQSTINPNSHTSNYMVNLENTENLLRINFNDIDPWYTVNDNVMGGVSEGSMQQEEPGIGLFSGQLSLDNRGGFSSVRTPIEPLILTEAPGLQLRVKGEEGRQFTLLLASSTIRGSWQKDFNVSSEWGIVDIPFASMQFSVRGWVPPSSPALNPEEIDVIGLMIKDKNEDAFRLEVDWIHASR